MKLSAGKKQLDLNEPKVMGILNVTPDSFSDGGRFTNIEQALLKARQMVEQGAAIVDIGGESTRPGAMDVEVQDELDRVIPVIEKIANELDCWISIDTSKSLVMQEAVNAGANLINDVRALRENGALQAAVEAQVPVCLMHMQGLPRSMQEAPAYKNLLSDVELFLIQRANECMAAGIKKENIILDLGFGFGKQLAHNFQLLQATKQVILY